MGNVQVGKCPYCYTSKLESNQVVKCQSLQMSVGKCPCLLSMLANVPIILLFYCMPQTVGHVRLDTLEEWYQEANVSTILLTDREH